MKKKLTFDFFQVIMPEGSHSNLGSILKNINVLQGKKRLDTIGEYPIRLQHLNNTASEFLGDIARIRMNDIPPKMKLSGETNHLELDEDEGLGEITSFIFHSAINVLMLMRNRNAVSISAFCHYIENFSGVQDIQFRYIFQPDIYKRLQRLEIIKKMELVAAAPGNGTIFRDLGFATGDLIDLMGLSPRARIQLICSTGYDKQLSLPKERILKIASALLSRKTSKIENIDLVISGKEENVLQNEVIDLFKDVLTDHVTIDIKEQRVVTDNHRHQAAKTVWAKHQDALIKLFTHKTKL